MRIALVSDTLPKFHKITGGAERACVSVGDVVSKDHEVTYVTRTFDRPLIENNRVTQIKTTEDYIKWRPLNTLIWTVMFDPIAFISSYTAFKNTDIVHMQHVTHITLAPIIAAKLLGKPVIYSFYDYHPLCLKCNLMNEKNEVCKKVTPGSCPKCVPLSNFNGLAKTVMKILPIPKMILSARTIFMDWTLQKVDAFVVLSGTWRDLVSDVGHIQKDKVHVVPLPVEVIHPPACIHDFTQGESILFVGWMAPHKGLDVVVKALSELVKIKPNLKLIVISADEEPEYKKQVWDFIREKKLEDNVIYLGKSSYAQIHEMLDSATVVVIAEQWKTPWSIFLTEAMAHGKPIVASDIGDLQNFIEHRQTGLLAICNDPDNFAYQINQFLTNPEESHRMGTNAQKKINEMTNPTIVLGKFNTIYRNVMVGQR